MSDPKKTALLELAKTVPSLRKAIDEKWPGIRQELATEAEVTNSSFEPVAEVERKKKAVN